MRSMIVAACAVGFLTFASVAQAATPTTHDLGGPAKMGKMCWVSTSPNDNGGYWAKCPKPAKAMKRAKKKK